MTSNMRTRFRPDRMHLACVIGLCAMLQLVPAFAQDQGGPNGGSVANATFTSGISDGEPVDYRQDFDRNTPTIYYYTEVLDLHGQTIHHRWKLEGKVMQDVAIPVRRSREGVWSKSAMQPEWTGNWTVEVVNSRGEVIEVDNFAYSPAD